jgi:hypothetical protein
MHAAYESESLRRFGPGADTWIAPVGQARAHSSQAVHRAKSIAGKPNAGRAVKGSCSVRIPVRMLLAMMRNIRGSSV